MKLAAIGIVRNFSGRIQELKEKWQSLRWEGEKWLCLAENDSEDDTLARLLDWTKEDPKVLVGTYRDRSRCFGSECHPERFRARAHAKNLSLGMAHSIQPDYILHLEVDLLLDPDLAMGLASTLETLPPGTVLAPGIWMPDGRFYDGWAFRPLDRVHAKEPVEMDTIGSIFLMKPDPRVWFCEEEEIVGFCRRARDLGHPIYYEPRLRALHPR